MIVNLSNFFIPFLGFLFFFQPLIAQTDYQWGGITQEELQMAYHPEDSSAEAAILMDHGKITVFSSPANYGHEFNHYRRIKIFKRAGFKWADVDIPYYSYKGKGKLLSVQARITLPNGQYFDLSEDDFFKKRINERLSALKFAFPKVEEGAVLEYRYRLSSDYMMELKPWYFQESIPVVYSQLQVENESRFSYVTLFETGADMEREDLPNGTTSFSLGNCRVLFGNAFYAMENGPAVRREAFVTTMDDYRIRIRFQLSEVYNLDGTQTQVLDTWENAARRLYEEPTFGHYYRKKRYYNKLLKAFTPLLEGLTTDIARARAAFDFLDAHLQWDYRFRLFPKKSPNEVFEQGSGSSTELIMALLALFHEAGLVAHPILISTRSHGKMVFQHPIIDQFNHVLAYVELEGEGVVIDMPGAGLPMGLLHSESSNGRGWLAQRTAPNWVKMTPKRSRKAIQEQIEVLPDEGLLKGKLSCLLENYEAIKERSALERVPESQHWANRLGDGLSVQKLEYQGLENKGAKVEAELEFTLSSGIINAGNFIYLSVPLFSFFKENPFKLEQRNYPVDMPYPLFESWFLEIRPPGGICCGIIASAFRASAPRREGFFLLQGRC